MTMALPAPIHTRLAYRPPVSAAIALAVFVLFALLVPRFFTFGNLENVARIASILCIAACGQAITANGCTNKSVGRNRIARSIGCWSRR